MLPAHPVPSPAAIRAWDSRDLTLYLRAMYRDNLDGDVYRCLQRYRISGPWFLYLREEDYIHWRFTAAEAKILVHEARMIEGGVGV